MNVRHSPRCTDTKICTKCKFIQNYTTNGIFLGISHFILLHCSCMPCENWCKDHKNHQKLRWGIMLVRCNRSITERLEQILTSSQLEKRWVCHSWLFLIPNSTPPLLHQASSCPSMYRDMKYQATPWSYSQLSPRDSVFHPLH